MSGSSSNDQSVDNRLNLMVLSQDDSSLPNPPSGIASLATVSSSSSTNEFLLFDTYETYRAHHHHLRLQKMIGQEMVPIINEIETSSLMFALDGTSINTATSRYV
jgi:hypothetical protein